MIKLLPRGAKQVREFRKDLQATRLRPGPGWNEQSQTPALRSVVQEAMRLPMYKRLWQGLDKSIQRAQTMADLLALLPVIDKQQVFGNRSLDELLSASALAKVGLVYSSSGFTGRFAWGVEARGQRDIVALGLDVLLDMLFNVATKPALIINALPTGVRIDCNLPMVIETGPRADSVVAALRTLRPCVKQTIVVGDWALLKQAIEQAVEQGVLSAKGGLMHLITGGDWIAENWRSYIMGLLAQVSPKLPGKCVINFGVSELGLSVGLETEACRLTRQAMHQDPQLAQQLLGEAAGLVVPTLVQYQPWNYLIETVGTDDGQKQLVVTSLQLHRLLPLVRYTTGDRAKVWSYGQWCEVLEHAGRPDLKPKERLPVLAIMGRGTKSQSMIGSESPLQVRETLFANPELARRVTGHFVLKRIDRVGGLQITMQLQPGSTVPTRVMQLFKQQLQQNLSEPVRVQPQAYHEYRFGMALNYLRKFDHVL